MGLLRGIHYFGSFLLLVGAVLFIISSISSPAVSKISMLTVKLQGFGDSRPSITFGSFGWCLRNAQGVTTSCSKSQVGYKIFDVLRGVIDGNQDRLDRAAMKTANGLTNVMVIHPIAAALGFITFILSLTPGMVGGVLTMLAALVTFILSLVVVVCDFILFQYVRNQIDYASDNSLNDVWASYGSATWTALVGMLLFFVAFVVCFITCCGSRSKGRAPASKEAGDYGTPAGGRRFWQRR